MRLARLVDRDDAAVFLLVLFGFAYFHGGGMSNQNARFDAIVAFAETGTFRIDRFLFDTSRPQDGTPEPTTPPGRFGNTIDWSFSPPPERGGRLRPDAARGEVQGHYYANKAPGTILLGSAAYFLLYHGQRAAGLDARGRPFEINLYLVNLAVSVLPAALAAAAFCRLLREDGAARAQAAALALAFAFATLQFPYSTLLFGHPTAASFIMLALAGLFRATPAGLLAAGLCAGLAVLCDYSAALAAAALGVFALGRDGRPSLPALGPRAAVLLSRDPNGVCGSPLGRRALPFAAGAAVPVLLFAAYHYACFGAPFAPATSYTNSLFRDEARVLGLFGAVDARRAAALLWGRQRGLLQHMPILLFALAGLARSLRREPADPKAWLSLSGMALFLALNASFNGWHGGATVCARYQIPALPFWALALRGMPWRGLWKRAFLAAAAFSAFNMLAVASVSPLMPERQEDARAPIHDPLWLPAKPADPSEPFPARSVYDGLYGWTYGRFFSGALAAGGLREYHALYIHGRRRWTPTNLGLLLGLPGLWSLLPWLAGMGAGIAFFPWTRKF